MPDLAFVCVHTKGCALLFIEVFCAFLGLSTRIGKALRQMALGFVSTLTTPCDSSLLAANLPLDCQRKSPKACVSNDPLALRAHRLFSFP